ncbi:hypothetical protein GCM10009742_37890 [Kribbella karoonensis]|uniref:Uncharacterized protein n=1 Tax=Kribbella karoonensis TaxID=324851 RepID=A0ABP4PVZ0_9ACTN
MNAFAVIACATPSCSVLMIVIPDANRPSAARNAAADTLPLDSIEDTSAGYAFRASAEGVGTVTQPVRTKLRRVPDGDGR